MTPANSSSLFTRFSKATARATGNPVTFAIALGVIVVWAVAGPIFHWSDTWQLVVNTGTTIVTFLMVFLIQATQNRDAEAIQIKLDEIIRSQDRAHNALLDLEELEEDDLVKVREEYLELADAARKSLSNGEPDTGVPDLPPMRRRSGDGKAP